MRALRKSLLLMIELKEFLIDSSAVTSRCVIRVHASDQLVLCMHRLIKVFERVCALKSFVIDMQQSGDLGMRSNFEMCFLGQKQLLVLSGFDQLAIKARERWTTYLGVYRGPHVLVAQITRMPVKLAESDNIFDIVVPERVGAQDIGWITHLWDVAERERIEKFLSVIMRGTGPLDIERVCALAQYAPVLGAGLPEFVRDWAELIVQPEQSLFDLSSRLFAGDTRRFLLHWSWLQSEYTSAFWTTYWSEQFFRAYWYVRTKKGGDDESARKISARLPFSFINRDWRLHDANRLAQAQDKAFELDVHLKSGGTEQTLMSLFIPFFH